MTPLTDQDITAIEARARALRAAVIRDSFRWLASRIRGVFARPGRAHTAG